MDGVARLPAAIPRAEVEAMRVRLWLDLTRELGIAEGAPATWTTPRPTGFQALAREGAFAGMASPALRNALDALFGKRGWQEPPHWGQPLVSFPEPGLAWDVPHRQWHLDGMVAPQPKLGAVRAFSFLTTVAPRGGATVALAGSQRLALALAQNAGRALRSAELRKELAACDPWLAALEADPLPGRVQRFMDEGAVVNGVPLRVIELCGEAGDVILMRPETLHAMAPHVIAAPRFVVAQFIYRAGA